MAPCIVTILRIHGTMHNNYKYRGFTAPCTITQYTGIHSIMHCNYIQGVLGGTLNILGGGRMDY
jgi:hypothetical protein